ncbi:GNAT family N-acetyltransferase [Virgibacillus proomii]|uniref:GNAT family N-acetyltransferase n=1 Tax=Virgibacillus proomii TaxID=84407 RepID=UPI001C122A18|nr:GNAT family N-acetyltransferase [Virgibacillus proomii]MBU5265668.1 GNAT family N-acetyltransferase [Virgibacillus proomii]
MIHKLEKKNYQKIRALLTPEQKNDLTLNAIINLTNRGTIYVDDVEQPRTALIDVTGVCSIFIGDVSNEQFISHLREFIENQLKIDTYESCGGTYFLVVITDETWEKVLRDVISHRDFEIDYEIYYQFNKSRFNSLKKSYKSLPDGYTIKKIDSEVISNDPDEIIFDVLSEFWYSVDDFLHQSFGYCVMKGNRIISACLSCCVNEKDHEISVETYDEEEMNKGLATLVCTVYLEHCIENGITPHWSTLETNVESKQLGKKLGFEFESKCKTLEFEF